ncbi:subtilisin-like protease SBT1.7 [Camellia sinensis]|uniref:Subtilisin-like protease n=1 Tax=Camellia sinensis var. sinensis TaxID=542762 RepID=A0A4S4DM26_CAMSN|nr:subtilisin-like protease SBT1.7 [Camellia sinensis]THG03146.1 hypothetical protein TEA_001713 [Camellia sinensis var. sinensis]
MEKKMLMNFLILLLAVLVFFHLSMASMEKKNDVQKRTYIVHMAKSQMPASFDEHTQWYDSSLKSVSDSAEMLYTYNTVAHGFSTRLTVEESQSLKSQPGVLSVFPETKYELHTTRTPHFLGLDKNPDLLPKSNLVSEIIVGVLDTGVWPERKNFDDTGLGPVPSKWKGTCETGTNFTASNCNRKLIGARVFYKGYEAAAGPIDPSQETKSPRDDAGHGTHTSSTAAGSVVVNASLFGYASGSARGMASQARVAVYKVCWTDGCYGSDILAGMDKAVDDNVNILSLSLGGGFADYLSDTVAIGAFAAMEKGILVSCSAGNSGPDQYSLSNLAPWITTVGAGTLDRDFPSVVRLGNGLNFTGMSLYKGASSPKTLLPLVYAGNASNATNGNLCLQGTLIPKKIRGKIVVCDRGDNPRVEKGAVVKAAGGAGMVLVNGPENGEEVLADAHLLPATEVGYKAGKLIKKYLFSDRNPTATLLFEGTRVGIEPSPVVAAFSSRGPNYLTPEILKPDLIAPGVNILAGWTATEGPTELPIDKRRVEFNIISGTSMSCPHVSGLAAILMAAKPEWSPAAIRSALMTTAYTTYKNKHLILDAANGKPSTPFDHGAGHVDPISAFNPGLVYDMDVNDYLGFLCASKFSASDIHTIYRQNFTCDPAKKYSFSDFNYPSFSVPLQGTKSGHRYRTTVVNHSRTLTNVGSPTTYNVSVHLKSKSVKVLVDPVSLSFARLNEKKTYTVTFTIGSRPTNTFSYGWIVWSDGEHVVRSPIAISWIY